MTATPTQLGFEDAPRFAPHRVRTIAVQGEQYTPEQWSFGLVAVMPPLPPLVPYDNRGNRGWLQRVAKAVNGMLRGNIGATLQVTLAARASASTLIDGRISPTCHLVFSPQTVSAATAWTSGLMYASYAEGSATIFHPNVTATDQTFSVAIIR